MDELFEQQIKHTHKCKIYRRAGTGSFAGRKGFNGKKHNHEHNRKRQLGYRLHDRRKPCLPHMHNYQHICRVIEREYLACVHVFKK